MTAPDETVLTDWESAYLRTRRGRWLRRRRLRRFDFRPRELILEVGCGDGPNLRVVEEIIGRAPLGLDTSRRLLGRARGLSVLAGDAQAVPIRDASLDAVLADSMLHHVRCLQRALREAARVLRPGGRLCVLEARPTLARRLLDLATFNLPVLPALRARREVLSREPREYHGWLRYWPDFTNDLRRAGFVSIRVRLLPFGAALECRTPATR